MSKLLERKREVEKELEIARAAFYSKTPDFNDPSLPMFDPNKRYRIADRNIVDIWQMEQWCNRINDALLGVFSDIDYILLHSLFPGISAKTSVDVQTNDEYEKWRHWQTSSDYKSPMLSDVEFVPMKVLSGHLVGYGAIRDKVFVVTDVPKRHYIGDYWIGWQFDE